MNEEQPKIIKKFEPATCPHCKETIYLGFQSMLPFVVSVLSNADIQKVKEKIKEGIENIQFKDEREKTEFLAWLEGTLLDNSDIEPILKQIATEQIMKIQKNGKNNESAKN